MAIHYKGDCSFQPTGPGAWKIDALGLDHYSIDYKGRADHLDDFLDTLVENSPHPDHPKVFLIDWNNDKNPVFSTVSLEYVGFKSGVARAPLYKPSKSVQSTQTSAELPDAGKSSIEVQFYAPTGEWTWYQFTDPGDDPDHYAVLSTKSPLDSITRWRITADDGTLATISLADLTAAMNSISVSETIQNFEAEATVPGHLWYCRCSSIRTLQPS